ncbi:MAG: hypothetical protein RLZZ524_3099 [Pseudomonadota bacterium]|jgi:hypothetical protein
MYDDYFSSVVLLLHFDGTNGATTTVDSSPVGWSVTVSGATLSTTSPAFGTAALNMTTDPGWQIAVDSSTEFNFGTGDFTVEGQVKTTASSVPILNALPSDQDDWRWYVLINASGYLEWWRYPAIGAAVKIAGATSAAVNTGSWVSWAASRASGTLKLFVNGVEVASASDSTDYQPDINFLAAGEGFVGRFDEVRITKGIGRYTAGYTAQTEAFPDEGPPTPEGVVAVAAILGQDVEVLAHSLYGFVAVDTLLGAPALRAHALYARASLPNILEGAAQVVAWHDFTDAIDETAPTRYVMDLVTPGGLVRVPISSWQATLQTDVQSYVQSVVPAAAAWVPDIEAATEFVISRRGQLLDGNEIEYEMARAQNQTVSIDYGPSNYTATLSGYTASLTYNEDPSAAQDRVLTGIRTVSRNSGTTRVRCSIDWLLRPGNRAFLDQEEIIVRYINYYVPGFDQYMDVGDRTT